MKLALLTVSLLLTPAIAAAQGFGKIDQSIFRTKDTVPVVPVRKSQMIVVDSFPCNPEPVRKAKAKRQRVRRRPKVAALPVKPDTTAVKPPVKKVVRKRHVRRPSPQVAANKAPPAIRGTPVRAVKMCAKVRTFSEPSQTLLVTDTSVVPLWTAALAPPDVTLPPTLAPDVAVAPPPVIGPSPSGGFPWLLPGIAIVPIIFGSFVNDHDKGNPGITPMVPFVPETPSVVPEPGTLTLLGTGLVGFAGVVRRRRRRGRRGGDHDDG